MNSVHIAQRLEELRRARLHAQTTGNQADWARVHNMQRELNEHAESHLWTLLAENKALRDAIRAKESYKDGKSW